MTYLLDTHVFIWSRVCPDRLGPKTVALLENTSNPLALSAVSALEVAQLVHKGKLVLSRNTRQWVSEGIKRFSCQEVGVSGSIAMEAYELPGDMHPDPADRLLVATARMMPGTLITADERLLDYPHVASWDGRK